jgi:putative SOS response-associated peptidase YedK
MTKDTLKADVRAQEMVFGFVPRYNIAPTQKVDVVVDTGDGVKQWPMKWGWKAAWGNQLHINAQSEKIFETATFKKYLHQRCLIAADGFYERLANEAPVRFVRRERGAFCFAGLWYSVERQELDIPTRDFYFVMLTRAADASVSPIHDRMPFIVAPGAYANWLLDDNAVATVLERPDETPLDWYPVSREVSNVRNENADLIRPVPLERELF